MGNNELFSYLDFVVKHESLYKDKVAVKAFFICNNRIIVKTIDVKKKIGANEAYYLSEAKKIFNAKVADGSLFKHSFGHLVDERLKPTKPKKVESKKDDNKKKKKKLLPIILIPTGALAVTGIALGCYFGLRDTSTKHTLTFVGTHTKMIDKNNKEVSTVKIEEGKVARYKLVGENDDYDLPPEAIFTTSNNEELTEGYTYDNDTGYFEVVMNQDVTVTATSYEKDAIMILYYDYHAEDDKDTVLFNIAFQEGTPNLVFDWGDGKNTNVTTDSNVSHKYNGEQNRYKITIKGEGKIGVFKASEPKSGFFPVTPAYYLSPGNEFLTEAVLLKSFGIGVAEIAGDFTMFLCSEGLNPNVKRLTIGHLVDAIPSGLFIGTGITDLFIPKTVTLIEEESFASDKYLSSVNFEEGSELSNIKHGAFGFQNDNPNNEILTSLTLPSSITKIGWDAFSNFTKLADFTCLAIDPPEAEDAGSRIFYDDTPEHIYVPSESVDAYKVAQTWSIYASKIEAIPTK